MTKLLMNDYPSYGDWEESLEEVNFRLEGQYDKHNLVRWNKYRNSANDSRFLDKRPRDPIRSALLKNLYNHQCQLCGCKQEISPGKYYSETHHLQQIQEYGPDVFANMIVVCKSCHLYLDKGSVRINLDDYKIHHFDSSHRLHRKTISLKHYIEDGYLLAQNERYLCV
jgi:predicted restriction endonuclease